MPRRAPYTPRHSLAAQPRRAFTIIELLIVVGIIIVLLSIIIVAVNTAVRTSQASNTRALMSSINQGLVQFQQDVGYLPPVLATASGTSFKASRDYGRPPINDGKAAEYLTLIQEWYSITTIAEYLLGYGTADEVGAGRVLAGKPSFALNENDPPLGIRHPGPDGYWGVASSVPGCVPGGFEEGTFETRTAFLGSGACETQSARYRQGRIYGPYFELRDERLLGAINPASPYVNEDLRQYQVFFPGDAIPGGLTWDELPKVVVDYWGQPIRYHRKPYVRGMPGQDIRRPQNGRLPTLSDIFALRPFRPSGDIIEGVADFGPQLGFVEDTTTTAALNAASFALFSPGPDRRMEWRVRADPEEYNADNIVELGR